MKIERFEEIVAWQCAREMTGLVYKTLWDCRDYGFRDQIERAAVSVMNNIAEGFEKKSNKEFLRYLKIAKGSCGEVKSMLYLAKDLSYIKNETFESLFEKTERIQKMIVGLIRSLEPAPPKT